MTVSLTKGEDMNQIQEAQQRVAAIENEAEMQMLLFNHGAMSQLMVLASEMAKATVTVPKHLQGKAGDCLAICMQAAQWRMNPFAVAQKTHIVNGVLGYEAQLVNAVVQSSGAIQGSFHYEYQGDNQSLACRVGAVLKGQNQITWGEWLPLNLVQVRNSPLWKTNPRQQLGYLQVKNWARAYCPAAILGVYSVDELQDYEANIKQVKDVTPAPEKAALITAEQKDMLLKAAHAANIDEAFICKMARISHVDELTQDRLPAALNHLKGMAIPSEAIDV